MTSDFEAIGSAYSAAIEAGSYNGALNVVQDALAAGASAAEIFDRVLAPAMRRVGERWERAELTVADEHLATAISNRVVGSVYGSLAVAMPTSKERVMIAAVEGDQHVMGLRMIADVLEGSGYETSYLGADTPLDALLALIERHGPTVVALGATAPWSAAMLLKTVLAIRAADPLLPIVVGGAQAQRAAALAADGLVFVAANAESVLDVVANAIRARSRHAAG